MDVHLCHKRGGNDLPWRETGKSRSSVRLDCVPLTAMRLSPTIRARRGPRKDSFSATALRGGEERRGRKFRPFGEIKTDAEINPYKDDFVDHFGDLEAERLVG